MRRAERILCQVLFLSAACAWDAAGRQAPAAFAPPEDIEYRRADIFSEGTRMSAQIYSLRSRSGVPLPTIIMAHGWGGTAAQLRAVALDFARAGYHSITFDYRGWGDSDSRIILTGPAPKEKMNHRFTAEVLEVREVVDPLDMTTDWLNVLHWVQGEPQCDKTRIGLWGTSYSGGHVIYAAARDPRVKATVSQVASMDSRPGAHRGVDLQLAYEEGTKRARGEIRYPPPRARVVGSLSGGPVREKLILYAPIEDVEKAPHCAMLFINAEKEELFDNGDHATKAYNRARGPKKLVEIPGITHYGIYTTARAQAAKIAIEWFDEHLKK